MVICVIRGKIFNCYMSIKSKKHELIVLFTFVIYFVVAT